MQFSRKNLRRRAFSGINSDEVVANLSPHTTPDFEGSGKQNTHTKKVMKDRKVVYIYTRTHDTVSSRINNATELGRDDCIRFLGPLSDFY